MQDQNVFCHSWSETSIPSLVYVVVKEDDGNIKLEPVPKAWVFFTYNLVAVFLSSSKAAYGAESWKMLQEV